MNPRRSARYGARSLAIALSLPLVCAAFLSGCAGQREAPPGTPEWVREGPGPAIADGTRYIYGVGVVGKMKSRTLMRAAADNKAKNKLGRAMDDYVDALMAAYAKSPQAAGDAEPAQKIEMMGDRRTVSDRQQCLGMKLSDLAHPRAATTRQNCTNDFAHDLAPSRRDAYSLSGSANAAQHRLARRQFSEPLHVDFLAGALLRPANRVAGQGE